MPNINDINGVTVANLAKLDAVLKANISKVNGLTLSAAAFLLDTYTGAALAVSVRLLDKDYTGSCMRIREDSGDTETDIGFDSNGDLDTASIASHCGSANGYVVTWYDQSGASNNLTQSTAGNQPQIYNGTAVITENGKPIISSQGVDDFLSVSYYPAARWYAYCVGKIPRNSSIFLNLDTAFTNRILTAIDNQTQTDAGASAGLTTTSGSFITEIYFDGVSQGSTATRDEVHAAFTSQALASFDHLKSVSSGSLYLGTGASFSSFDYQEFIIFETDQSSNRSGIETDINGYFSIYS